MTLDVLDETTLARLGQIGVWVSLYWDEPYNTLQSSLLEVRPTRENLELLREGRWLRRSDSNVPMRICHRSNENEGANLVCTLYPATWILSKRVSTEVVKNENAEAAMRRLVAAMDPWPRLELGELVGFDTRYTAQTSGGYTVTGEGDPEIDALVLARGEAKKAKNFAEADRIRDELKAKGIDVTDVPGGAVWKRI